jgi:hypothetical protein
MCQVAIRLSAAHAARAGGDWRTRLLESSVWFVELYGCRWFPAARHLRTAARDDPPDDEPGESLIYRPFDGLFHCEQSEEKDTG